MSVQTTSGNGGPVTDEGVIGQTGSDIVSVRNDREVLAGVLRSGVGFRVDCPEGRVGVLTRVIPDDYGLVPARIEVATGLFIVVGVEIPFAEVASVDPQRRRVFLRSVPERRRRSPSEMTRTLQHFLRAGGRSGRGSSRAG